MIDTSAVIKFLNETFPINALHFLDKILDEECMISFITQIELLAWNQSEEEMKIVEAFIVSSEILWINQSIVDRTIEIRKKSKIKLPDALIAATAIEYGLTLLADNDKDFNKVEAIGLKYVNPKTYPLS